MIGAAAFPRQVSMLDLGIGVTTRGAVPERLHLVYLMIKEFCKEKHIPLHMSNLTPIMLGYTRDHMFPCGILGANPVLCVSKRPRNMMDGLPLLAEVPPLRAHTKELVQRC